MKRFILLILLALGPTACQKQEAKPFPTGATHVSAFAGGIEIRATVSGLTSFLPGSGRPTFERGDDSAVITTAKHRIVIEKERVTIDGAEFAKLPIKCRYVELWLDGEGAFSMNTDGKGVATMSKQLSK